MTMGGPRYQAGTSAGLISAHLRALQARCGIVRDHLIHDAEVDWETLFLDTAALELRLDQLAKSVATLRQAISGELDARSVEAERGPALLEVEREDAAYVGALR